MPQFAYDFDPHAANDDNIVRDESHALSATMKPYRVIIPDFAPFFEDLELSVECNNRPLLMGVDYYLSHKYFTGIERTGKLMYSGIWIVNPKLSGTVTVKYRTLGGKFPVARNVIDDYLTNRQTDPQHATWEEVINDDPVFPPVDLQFDRDAFIDEENLQGAIKEIADVVRNKDQTTDDMYELLDDWFLTLKKIVDDSPLKTHQGNFNNPHNEKWFESEALHELGIAKNAAKAFNRTINELADYVNERGVTQSDLDNYVRRSGGNLITGDIVLKDGVMSLQVDVGSIAYVRINMSNGNIGFDAISDTLIHADRDENTPGAKARLKSGHVELSVTSAGSAQTDDDLKVNDKILIHDGNLDDHIPESGTHIIDIETKNHPTLTFGGKGVSGDPLYANVTLNDATETVDGVAVGTDDITKDQPTKVAFSKGSVKLDQKVKQKVSNTVTINGVRLDQDIVLNKSHFGLGNVANLPDTEMPVNQNHLTTLAGKATGEHTHDFSEIGFARATSSVFGVTYLAEDPTSTASDRGFSAYALSLLDTEVIGLGFLADTRLPDDVIDITQYGGNSYLPVPVQGEYGQAGDNRSSLALVGLVEPDNKLVVLRNGQDGFGSGVYYWYCDVLSDGSIANYVSTATKYHPKYLKDKGYEDIEVNRIYRGSEDCFAAIMSDGTPHIILTNGTMDMSKHVGCRIDAHRGGSAWSTWMVDGYVYYIVSVLNNSQYFTELYRVKVDDIINGNSCVSEQISLSGVDQFGTTHTNVDRFHHCPEGVGTDADPNHLICRQDNSYWGTINLCHGPTRNYDAVLEGSKLRIIHTSTIYLANSFSSKWQGTWTTSYWIDLKTGQITKDHGGFPVYLRQNGYFFDNGNLKHGGTPGLAANNTGGVIRSRGHQFYWSYSNITRPAYIRGMKNGNDLSDFEGLHRDQYNPAAIGSGSYVKGNYGSPVESTLRAIGLLPDDWFIAEHDTTSNVVMCKFDRNNPYEGQLGFGPTSERHLMDRGVYTSMMRIPRTVEADGTESNKGQHFGRTTVGSPQPREITNRALSDKTASMPQSLYDSLAVQLKSLYSTEMADDRVVGAQVGVHIFGDMTNKADCDVFISYYGLYANTPGDLNGQRSILQAWRKVSAFTLTPSGNNVELTSVTIGDEIHKDNWVGSYRYVGDPVTTVTQGGRYKMSNGETLYIFGNLPYYGTVGGSGGNWVKFFTTTGADDVKDFQRYGGSHAYSIAGCLYSHGIGAYTLSAGLAHESVNMSVKEVGSAGWGTEKWRGVFAATKVAEGWVIYFTQDVQFFINSTRFVIPETSIDLSTTFPSTHSENTFYIYASVDGGSPHYYITDQRLTDSSTAIYIGYCRTDATQIVDLQVNRATRLGNFREFDEHLNDPKPHGLDLSQVTTDDIGLGLIENKDIRHSLVVPSFREVFDSWYRLSHNASGNYPAIASETTTWEYLSATDSIRNTTNSSSFVGMVSPEDVAVGDYDFITGVSSTSGDDDWVGVIFAMVEKDGTEHTLTAICAGTDTRNVEFGIYYNWNQGAGKGQKTLFSHTTALKHGWDEIPERIITVKRRGDKFAVDVTKMMTDAATAQSFEFDVKDHPELAIFRGAVRFGYCAQSQPHSTWRNILRPDEDGKNFYASQKLYRDNFSWSSRLKVVSGTVQLTKATSDFRGSVPIPPELQGLPVQVWSEIIWSGDSYGGVRNLLVTRQTSPTSVQFTTPDYGTAVGGFNLPLLKYVLTFFTDPRMI